ncbi:diadenylate cyclase CdaA [Parasporobacterium paucivorans]|uniref:Diadenylate cyclase n=1 Tax=Parasporobacterium paucivorans DSM 15970 TaxID=1122934 RepID=A0A1M6JSH9_9FIRM|nr:diadenylate cyclase CdaA [Parasporobacterium paucivorans]SHJ49694.1 diadenylate cyclase [Parasporobacterium paucivorans DSM 15970]
MEIFNAITYFFEKYFAFPSISVTDIVEIVIISFLFYEFIIWIKRTKAWTLVKGIAVVLIFTLLALIFNLTTILWIAEKTFNVGVIAIIIVFQPELRKVLEQLGRKNIFGTLFPGDESKNVSQRFKDITVNEIVKAVLEMSRDKTGALIVIEQEVILTDYERTGITIDAALSSQLLVNIFEHNTPLHDGAVIIRGDRIASATCYLPLSDNMELSKELGTRHRAAVGISEATDALTIVVSEETGKISITLGGKLLRDLDGESLKKKLVYVQNKSIDVKRFRFWKGRRGHEKTPD